MFKHKSGSVTVTNILTVAAVLLMACGCQDTRARKAGKDVRQAIDDAQRIYDTAQAMLNNPVYVRAPNELLPGNPANPLPVPTLAGTEEEQQRLWYGIMKIPTMAPDTDEPNLKPAPGAILLKDILGARYNTWKSFKQDRWASMTIDDILTKGEAALTVIDKLNDIAFIGDTDYFKLREELAKLSIPSVLPTTLPARQIPKIVTAQSDEEQKNVTEPYLRSPANPASIEVVDRKLGSASATMPAGGASTHSLSLSPMDPTLVVNPKVPAKLKEAEDILTKAINENKEAPKGDLVMAYLMRARVRCLLGYYHYLNSKPFVQAIDGAVMRGQWVACLMKLDTDKKPYLDALIKNQEDSTDLNGKLLSGEGKAKEIEAQITANTDEQKKVSGEITQLNNRIAELNKEIMDLRAKSALQKGEESIKTYDLTEPKNQEIKESYAKIGQLEMKLSELRVDEKQLQTSLAVANAKKKAGDNIVAQRAKTKGQLEAQQKEIDERLKIWQDLMAQISSEMFYLMGLAKTSCDEAKRAYDIAKADLVEADKDCPQSDKTDVQAQLGDLRMTIGEQMVRTHQILGRINGFAEFLTNKIYKDTNMAMPDSVVKLSDCAKNMDDVKKEATSNFSEAAANFKNAADRLEKSLDILDKSSSKGLDARDLQWAYQGRMADAYVMLLTLDPKNVDYLNNARDFINKALAGKEASPMLANIRRLQDMLPK